MPSVSLICGDCNCHFDPQPHSSRGFCPTCERTRRARQRTPGGAAVQYTTSTRVVLRHNPSESPEPQHVRFRVPKMTVAAPGKAPRTTGPHDLKVTIGPKPSSRFDILAEGGLDVGDDDPV